MTMHPATGADPATAVDLTGVPETMLWPLWHRAAEMGRRDRLIDDPMAADLVARIDYDFAGRFGKPNVAHAVRARFCDDLIRAYLKRTEGDPVVVALGDGLETQFWRVDDGRVRWFSVDLPEAVETRRRLLPQHPRAALIQASALDPGWMDGIPDGPPPFISAAGLLMYFEEDAVKDLLERLAARFGGAEVFFDTIPPYFSRKTMRGFKVTPAYTAPPMPWGISVDDIPDFIARIPALDVLRVQTYADPFPRRMRLYKLLSLIAFIRNRLAPGLVHGCAGTRHGG